jgi:hypothetical protein
MNQRVICALAVIASAVSQACAATLDTTPYYNNAVLNGLGTGTSTVGETFVAPTDHVLQDFTFYLGITTGHLSIQADVFQWSGPLPNGAAGHAVGTPLYQSASVPFTGTSHLQPFTVTTGGTPLAAGVDYVMLLTISNPSDYAASSGSVELGLLQFAEPGDGGGSVVWDRNQNNFSALTTTNWVSSFNQGPLEFTAHFTVPEPPSVVLAAITFLSVGWLAVRHRGRRSGV